MHINMCSGINATGLLKIVKFYILEISEDMRLDAKNFVLTNLT